MDHLEKGGKKMPPFIRGVIEGDKPSSEKTSALEDFKLALDAKADTFHFKPFVDSKERQMLEALQGNRIANPKADHTDNSLGHTDTKE